MWLKVAFQSGKFLIDNSQAKNFRIEDFRVLLSTYWLSLLENVKSVRLKETWWNQKTAVSKRKKQIFLLLLIDVRTQNSLKHLRWYVFQKAIMLLTFCWAHIKEFDVWKVRANYYYYIMRLKQKNLGLFYPLNYVSMTIPPR